MIINFWICQTHPGHFKGLSVFKLELQDYIRTRQTKTVVRGRPTRPCRQRTKILALIVQHIDVFGRWAKIIIFRWTSGQIFDDGPLKNIKMWTELDGWTDGRTSVQGGLDYKVSYFWTENSSLDQDAKKLLKTIWLTKFSCIFVSLWSLFKTADSKPEVRWNATFSFLWDYLKQL